jgi:molybdate transport system substrate-binding protein
MMPLIKTALISAAALIFSGECIAAELRVAVASNFAPVMEKLRAVFEQNSGHSIIIIAGATGQHYTQITNGAPFDVFIAADDERPARLASEGHAVAGSTFTYAIGRLVLWSADARTVDVKAAVLHTGSFRHLAIADPKLAPYGKAAEEVLRGMNLWDTLQGRMVFGENISQTLQFVQSGNAELGFIAKSQWLEVDSGIHGSVWEVPAELHTPIVQQGVLVRTSPAGSEFVTFIQGEYARSIIMNAGYSVP